MRSKKLAIFIAPFILLGTLVSCGNSAPSKTDYVHNGEVTLGLDYRTRAGYGACDFYRDGVVEVELAPKGCIDGDTVHFYPKTGTSSGRIKARFYGVDTPESTGAIEPWGMAASRFTKTKIMNANENGTIVVSSPNTKYGEPSPDSTGSRYVLMVWVNETKKNAPLTELYSLNLWLVQEGLSWAKNVDDMPQYKETFFQAEQQARDLKLYIFSGQNDPEYNYGDYMDYSFLEISKELQEGLLDPDYEYSFNNAKVHLAGTISGFSNGTMFLQNYYAFDEGSDKEDGEYCGLPVYTGASGIPSRFKIPNTYIEIFGVAKYSQFGFQITDTYFPINPSDQSKRAAHVLILAEDNVKSPEEEHETLADKGHKLKVFEKTADELDQMIESNDLSLLFSPVTISESVVVSSAGSYISDKNYASLVIEGHKFATYCAFMYRPYPDVPEDDPRSYLTWTELSDFAGKHFNIDTCVLAYHEDNKGNLSIQFCPTTSKNFRCLDLEA